MHFIGSTRALHCREEGSGNENEGKQAVPLLHREREERKEGSRDQEGDSELL